MEFKSKMCDKRVNVSSYNLTIITICLNSERTIGRTIESIKNQTYQNFEYIVIDGGSTDNTVNIISRYKKYFSNRLKIISETDSGIYNAMNKGIRKASGRWIHILNSDDYYTSKRALEKIFVDLMPSSSIDWIVNNICLKDKILMPVIYKNLTLIPHPGLIVQKRFYNQNGLYDERYQIISDCIFINKYFSNANIFISNYILVEMGPDGISNKLSLRFLYETLILNFLYIKIPIYAKMLLSLNILTMIDLNKFLKFRKLSSGPKS